MYRVPAASASSIVVEGTSGKSIVRGLRAGRAQRQDGDLGARAVAGAHAHAGETDPGAHVQPRAPHLVQAAVVVAATGALEESIGDAADVDLSAVRVAGEDQVRAVPLELVHPLRAVAEDQPGPAGRHARKSCGDVVLAGDRIVDADHV